MHADALVTTLFSHWHFILYRLYIITHGSWLPIGRGLHSIPYQILLINPNYFIKLKHNAGLKKL